MAVADIKFSYPLGKKNSPLDRKEQLPMKP